VGGNSGGNSFDAGDIKSIAIGLAPATAAPVDTRVCIKKQTRGLDLKPVPVAFTGNNKYDMDCIEEERDRHHCLDLADRYAAWGRIDLAVQQAASCDGVEYTPVPVITVTTPPEDYVTQEELRRAFETAMSK
jgi:hypothetical protein